jgi:chemotaxis protein CheZ
VDNPENSSTADSWNELQQRSEELIATLETGDVDATSDLLETISRLRDQTLYHEVGKLTRALHDAITNFDIDTTAVGIDGETGSQMVNARERLDYVINLTQKSADKTMDMVEDGMPLASSLGASARELKADWQRLIRREMQVEEFRELYQRMDVFLDDAATGASRLEENFNNILLAQDFQDLSGQVIKKVISLVQDVESRLVDLMRMAGRVEALTGIVHSSVDAHHVDKAEKASILEGPQIKPEGRDDVASSQDDVDDLLSSLGF